MAFITFKGHAYTCGPSETLLDCLDRAGERLPRSCRSGSCQSCLVQAVEGAPPARSQVGLKSEWVKRGYMLACQCRPTEDLTVARPGAALNTVRATLVERRQVGATLQRLWFDVDPEWSYRAGQFVFLSREDGLRRPYSIASVRHLDDRVEIHVRRRTGGRFSGWLCDAPIGTELDLLGPSGDSVYRQESTQESLLLVGAGTGIAPLWGVLRDALSRGHQGDIDVIHGASGVEDLYLFEDLQNLELDHEQLRVNFCTGPRGEGPTSYRSRLYDHALTQTRDLSQRRVYLAGDPKTVNVLRRRLFIAGASLQRLHADPFDAAA